MDLYEALESVLEDEVFDGWLIFTYNVNAEHNLIDIVITELSPTITASVNDPVRVVVTVTMDMSSDYQEYIDIINETISITFTDRVIPDNVDTFDESLFNLTPKGNGDDLVYELSWKPENTASIDELIYQLITTAVPLL